MMISHFIKFYHLCIVATTDISRMRKAICLNFVFGRNNLSQEATRCHDDGLQDIYKLDL